MNHRNKLLHLVCLVLIAVAVFLLNSLIIMALYNYPIKYLLWVLFSYNVKPISYGIGMLVTFVLMIIRGFLRD